MTGEVTISHICLVTFFLYICAILHWMCNHDLSSSMLYHIEKLIDWVELQMEALTNDNESSNEIELNEKKSEFLLFFPSCFVMTYG